MATVHPTPKPTATDPGPTDPEDATGVRTTVASAQAEAPGVADDPRPTQPDVQAAPAASTTEPAWTARWWKLMDTSIGIIPIPVYLLLVALLIALTAAKGVTGELAMVISIAALFAFSLSEVGNRIPGLKQIGGGALLVTFVPSLLGYLNVIPQPMTKAVSDFFSSSKILNLFIAAVIVGSILSMNRSVLIKGFAKIFVPLLTGTVFATALGMGVGLLTGREWKDVLFYTVLPIMAGGVGEGAIPLTIGYAQVLGTDQGPVLARVLPPIMVGNLTAVALSGVLAWVARRRPELTGNGDLQPGGDDLVAQAEAGHGVGATISSFAGAVMLAVALYMCGLLTAKLWGWPAPVVMLFLAVLFTLGHLVSPAIKAGAGVMYKGALQTLAFPVLFIFSLTQTPWTALLAGFAPANLAIIVATVVGMVGGGFLAARWVNLYPIESAIVTATHSGMGGAGDIAILTAADRMRLMPFAQIATRIGGGINVALALILFGLLFHG